MRITESQLRRIVREELLREGGVSDTEFMRRVMSVRDAAPDLTPEEIVADVVQDYAEDMIQVTPKQKSMALRALV